MTDQKNRKENLFLLAALLLAALYFQLNNLFRPIWCDEAITITNFALLPNVSDIYWAYIIPNNQIVYTFCLRFWMDFCELTCLPMGDFMFRFPSVIFGLLSVSAMFLLWKRRLGTFPAFFAALALTLSMPFEIYSVAIRGYMLSIFLIVLGIHFACRWRMHRTFVNAAGYFLCALLAVGTMPSNLIAFSGICLLFVPCGNFRELRRWRFWWLSAAPLIATALFYLPLYDKVANILTLKEGWRSKEMVVAALYGAFLLSALPLLVAAITGLRKSKQTKYSTLQLVVRCEVFLLPVPFIFIREYAPFPRIFLSLWPVWMFLLAIMMRPVLSRAGWDSIKPTARHAVVVLMFCLILWTGMVKLARDRWSDTLIENGSLDDFYKPYYLENFQPFAVTQKLKELYKSNPEVFPVYLTFSSDPNSLLFYGSIYYQLPNTVWSWDNPKSKVDYLKPNSLAIVRNTDDLKKVQHRFKLPKAKLIRDFGKQQIYLLDK